MLRVRSPDLGISRADEAEHAGHDVQVLAEILARERTAVVRHRGLPQHVHDRTPRDLRAHGVVREARIALLERELHLGPESVPYLAHDALEAIGNFAAQLFGPGAHRSRKVGVTSHNVARLATVELAYGDNDRVERRHVAADEHLQPVYHLRPHDDGVDTLVRHGTVRGDALDVNVKPVGVGHALPWRARHRARVDLAPDVRAVNGVDAVERASVDHGERSYRNFLSRLEQGANLAFELRFRLEKNADRTEHHGHVRIVAARVHDALVLGGE